MRETGAQRQFGGTGNVGNDDFDFGQQGNKATEPEQDKTNKMIRAHCEDAGQHGHPPSLIRVSAVHPRSLIHRSLVTYKAHSDD